MPLNILLVVKVVNLWLRRKKKVFQKLGQWLHKKKCVLILGLFALLGLGLADHFFPPNLSKIKDPSILILDKDQQPLMILLSKDEYWRLPISLKEVDPLFIKMLVQFEDKRFFYHFGIDPIALTRALFQYIKNGKVVSGGSSLTMQTVRLLEPRKRHLGNKLIEMLRALQLEAHFSKQEILEFYLMLAPYGGNTEGIRMASINYFGKEPKELRPSEAAMLVILPQSPNRLQPLNSKSLVKKFRDKVLLRMRGKSFLTDKAIDESITDSIPVTKHSFPRFAPHVAFFLSTKSPLLKIHHTTIDLSLQKQMERLAQSLAPFMDNTQSLAILIVDNKTQQVRSLVGSLNYFDEKRKGSVNMVKAIRSPGSLLKPFIYGFAFEEGLVHPDSLIQDLPTQFSDYRPSNFQGTFHGMVTIKEALKQSLNIPAVALLEKLGPHRFFAELSSVVSLKFSDKNTAANLTVALGGVGMTLWDCVSLYTALANQGLFKSLSLTLDEASRSLTLDASSNIKNISSRLLTEKSARMITEILSDCTPPDGFVDRKFISSGFLAYKTGTSYGYRDAWAIGYNDQYTVGVWLGKPDGSSSGPNTGRKNAAPILFKIFDYLPKNNKNVLRQASLNHDRENSLPQHLKEFQRKKRVVNKNKVLHIEFPKDGSRVYLDKQQDNAVLSPKVMLENLAPLTILVQGGTPPYHCFINGHPMTTPYHSAKIKWLPDSSGFTTIMILDSLGNADSVTVELR